MSHDSDAVIIERCLRDGRAFVAVFDRPAYLRQEVVDHLKERPRKVRQTTLRKRDIRTIGVRRRWDDPRHGDCRRDHHSPRQR